MRRGAIQPDTHWAQQGTPAHLSLSCLCLLSFLGATGRRLHGWAHRPLPPLGRRGGGLCPAAPPTSSGTQLSPVGQPALKAHLLTALQSDPPKPIAKKVCDAISELAALLLLPPPGVDLLPLAFPPATPPRFVLPIRHPNLPTSAGHGACRSDAAPAPRPLLAGPRRPLRAT